MPSGDRSTEWVPMYAIGVRRPRSTSPPMLVLVGLEGGGVLQIPLAAEQAHLLAHELAGDATPYSATAELVEQLLSWLDARTQTITLTEGEGFEDVVEIEVERRSERRALPVGTADAALLSRRLRLPIRVAVDHLRSHRSDPSRSPSDATT